MASVAESKIKEELQRHRTRELYVLAGEDPFKLEYYANAIFREIFPEGGSREILYGDELDTSSLLDQARTFSLWEPTKFILVRQGERLTAKQWEALLPLLTEPMDRCCLLFQCARADARFKFFQALAKAPERAALVKLEPAGMGEASAWLKLFLRELGKEIDEGGRGLLLEWTAGSLLELKHLVERASLYSGSNPQITREHIQAVGFRTAPEDIFRFTGSLLQGDRSSSLALLETLLRQGEEPLALVGLLARQYRWLLSILALRAEGEADNAIASKAGLFPAAAKVLLPASRRLGGKGVIRGLQALAETDYGLKSSGLPKEQLLSGLVMRLTE